MPGIRAKSVPRAIPPGEVHETINRYLIADGFPIVFDLKRSRGSRIVDAVSGDSYLDFYSFFASLPLGFHHPAFHTAENSDRLFQAAIHKPSNSDADSSELAGFLESFSAHAMPEPFRHLFFIEGGALAVENALKTAFDWKVRKNLAAGRDPLGSQILHFRQAFHGRSGYTLSLTNTLPIKVAHFPRFPWPRVTNPALRFPVTEAETARVGAEEARATEEIRQAFASSPHDIAAIVIEPIQGEGGDNHFRPEFLAELRDLANEHEALLIFDEVQTGFGITGKFWAFQHSGVVPDIVCFGKKSQVCGIMAGPRVDEVPENVFAVSSRLNSTWGGGLVDMVRCQIILEVMAEEGLVAQAAQVGEYLGERLTALTDEFPGAVFNSRGAGLFRAFDCRDSGLRERVLDGARKARVLVLPCGERSIRLRPALNIRKEEVTEGCDCLQEVLAGLCG